MILLTNLLLPVELHILNRLSYHLVRLQNHHPSSLSPHFWREQELQIFHLGSHALRLRLPIQQSFDAAFRLHSDRQTLGPLRRLY